MYLNKNIFLFRIEFNCIQQHSREDPQFNNNKKNQKKSITLTALTNWIQNGFVKIVHKNTLV